MNQQRKFTFKKPELPPSSASSNTIPNVASSVEVTSSEPSKFNFSATTTPAISSTTTTTTTTTKPSIGVVPSNYVLNKNENLMAKASMIPFSIVNKKKSPTNKSSNYNKAKKDNETLDDAPKFKHNGNKSNVSPTKNVSSKSSQSKSKQTSLMGFMTNSAESKPFKQVTKSSVSSDTISEDLKQKLNQVKENLPAGLVDDDDDDADFLHGKKKPLHQSTQIQSTSDTTISSSPSKAKATRTPTPPRVQVKSEPVHSKKTNVKLAKLAESPYEPQKQTPINNNNVIKPTATVKPQA